MLNNLKPGELLNTHTGKRPANVTASVSHGHGPEQ